MKGLIIHKIPQVCDNESIIACLNLYGNLVSYDRKENNNAFIVYEKQLVSPLPMVWCRDYRLNLSFAREMVFDSVVPPLIPKLVQDRVAVESKRFVNCLEYIITGYPRNTTIDKLRVEIIIRCGHFVTIEFKQRIAFVFFDRRVRESNCKEFKITMSHQSKRKFEETDLCLTCDAFNPKGFITCILCSQKRCWCIGCNRENLPQFKFCNFCGKRQVRPENSINQS